jgi:serine/threonine-protein kinase RsbW
MAAEQSSADRGRGPTIELHIPSELGWERTAMDVAGSVAARMGFPAERVDDIKTAIAEATINAIEHGNALDASQKVFIMLIPEGESLEINVRDQSTTPFTATPADADAPSMDDKLAGLVHTRGWGTFLIKSLVDEVEFTSTSEGNLVRMVIHLDR